MSNARELAELGGSYGTGGFVGMKNRIINGAMMIDQRNAGASVTIVSSTTTYTVDRWNIFENGSMSFTAQQSTTAPAGFKNSLLVTSTAAVTPSAADRSALTQTIEGFNIADFGWGTANAATITLSFWVRSSLTGQFGGSLQDGAQAYSYPFAFTINAANTFEYKTITIAGPTSGTWNFDNTTGVRVAFDLGMGSDLLGTAGAWVSADKRGATGDTRINGTNGATFYITGVQLEKGTSSTSFDYRPYGTELALCQRYCFAARPINNGGIIGLGQAYSATNAIIGVNIPASMRSAPTVTRNGLSVWNANVGSDLAVSSISVADGTPSFVRLDVTVASGLVAGNAVFLEGTTSPSNTGYLILSSEL